MKTNNKLPNPMTWSTCDVFYINIIATRPNGYAVITYKRKFTKEILLMPCDAARDKRR